MLDRNLIRHSPNSLAIIIALGVALLTIIAGVGLLLLLGLRSSTTAVAAVAATAPLQSDRALLLPAIVLLVALLLLLLPLIWRYRRRATQPVPPR
jgi:multisubunit Na+/H+ antiporter MnhC subunit